MANLLRSIALKFKLLKKDSKESSDADKTITSPSTEEYVSVEVNQNGDPIIPDPEADVTKEEMADFFNENKKDRKNVFLDVEEKSKPMLAAAAMLGAGEFYHDTVQPSNQPEQLERTPTVFMSVQNKTENRWLDILSFKALRRTSIRKISTNNNDNENDNDPCVNEAGVKDRGREDDDGGGAWHTQTKRKRGTICVG